MQIHANQLYITGNPLQRLPNTVKLPLFKTKSTHLG